MMNTKRHEILTQMGILALSLALAWLLACTPAQLRTTRDIGAGAAGLACAVAGAAKGQPWASTLAAVGCGIKSLLQRIGPRELAPMRQIPLLEATAKAGRLYGLALETGLEADVQAARAAYLDAAWVADEYEAGR